MKAALVLLCVTGFLRGELSDAGSRVTEIKALLAAEHYSEAGRLLASLLGEVQMQSYRVLPAWRLG